MKSPAIGEAAAHLPWLSPGAATLIALVQQPTDAWQAVRADVGCLLLALRYTSAAQATTASFSYPGLLHEPTLYEGTVRHLSDTGPGFVNDSAVPAVRTLREAALAYAGTAARLAECSGDCDPEHAWVAGLLAPLGWYAVAAVAPDELAASLTEPALAVNPREAQRQRWGLTAPAVARRLARRWRLPRWLAVIVGHLDIAVATAQTLGADAALFRVVQTAVGLSQQRGILPLLPCPAPEGGPTLDLAPGTYAESSPPACNDATDPRSIPLLPDLLRLAADNRRLHSAPVLVTLESDLDRLQEALQEQREGEGQRLQTRKLRALAEFAAGAGHEINNPLAVISGQAQYLLNQEHEPARQKCLQKIIGQAQRIHQIIQELMQFARPAHARPEAVEVNTLVQEVILGLAELASQRHVQLHCIRPEAPVWFKVDRRQVATALACLLRNAIEAAPCDGWATVRVDSDSEQIVLAIEDNGAGLTPAQREHLFDPFYSGRQAGRGRGLGLPTSWRLAQENGGDVRFEPLPGGPTRFVLTFSRERMSSDGSAPPPLSAAC